MKLLLHTCCAPCLIYPLEKLREEGYEVAGLFYNPNIHPAAEFENRKKALDSLNNSLKIDIIYPEYAPADFFRAINSKPLLNRYKKGYPFLGKEQSPQRCSVCWRLRMKRAAQVAKEKGFDSFSTTLLVSPYQNQELLQEIGNAVSREEGIGFHYEDFRTGFRKAHDEARGMGIYCQKYCGCVYSKLERECKK